MRGKMNTWRAVPSPQHQNTEGWHSSRNAIPSSSASWKIRLHATTTCEKHETRQSEQNCAGWLRHDVHRGCNAVASKWPRSLRAVISTTDDQTISACGEIEAASDMIVCDAVTIHERAE